MIALKGAIWDFYYLLTAVQWKWLSATLSQRCNQLEVLGKMGSDPHASCSWGGSLTTRPPKQSLKESLRKYSTLFFFFLSLHQVPAQELAGACNQKLPKLEETRPGVVVPLRWPTENPALPLWTQRPLWEELTPSPAFGQRVEAWLARGQVEDLPHNQQEEGTPLLLAEGAHHHLGEVPCQVQVGRR